MCFRPIPEKRQKHCTASVAVLVFPARGKERIADGQKYAGRGHVMITGATNYKRIGSKIGVDLFNNPDLALVSDNSVKILVMGMKEGWFTGKKLSDYIMRTTKDYKNARRVINGVDKAQKIANEATIFEKALRSY